MRVPSHLLLFLLVLTTMSAFGQQRQSTLDKVINLPTNFFQKLHRGVSNVESKIDKQTEKYLNKLLRQEEKLRRKLYRIDSSASNNVFGDTKKTYKDLLDKLQEKKEGLDPLQNSYVPFLDTLKTSLRFLDRANEFEMRNFENVTPEVKEALIKLNLLQGKFNQTEEIKKLLQERKQFLKQQLSKFGLIKEFKRFEQDVYYYQEQVKQYRNLLNDPKALEATAIRLIQKLPAVSEFLSRHSELASLFRLPIGPGVSGPLNSQGLQTRNSVLQQMQQTLGAGASPQQLIQQSNPDLRSQLNQLRDRVSQLGGGLGSDEEMPDFKPNNEKTRSLANRLELGTNIQSVRGNRYFPVTTDIGLSLGFKVSQKNVAGVALSYKLGLGSGWRDINLTHQGIGLRTFWDWKIKGGFWLSAGAEMNYRNEIKKVEVLKNFSAWQQSALAGITKKYKAGKKIQGNIQLLYDFLHQRQAPPSPAFVFRVGYNLSK